MEGQGSTSPGGRVPSWTGITAATGWLRTRTPFQATGLPGSLTGAGLRNVSPTGVMPQLRVLEKHPHARNSGTNVDGQVVEFITPKVVQPHTSTPRSFTDGTIRRLSLTEEKDIASMRDTVDNLCEELDRQKRTAERLQSTVDSHQTLIAQLLSLEDKVTQQQQRLSQQLLEGGSGDGSRVSVAGLCGLVCRTLLTWTPLPYILSLIDRQHLVLWLNKCLRLMISFLLFLLFKSWLRLCGLGEIVNKVEAVMYKITKILMSPFRSRQGGAATHSAQSLMWDRDKGLAGSK